MILKIVSWNINGLNSALKQQQINWQYDSKTIYCLQETKIQKTLLTDALFSSKVTYWNFAEKAGYSGVATVVDPNLRVLNIQKEIADEELDKEGRVLATEFESFILVNVYAPHSHRKLLRLEAKERFGAKFLLFIKKLQQFKKPIIIVGDLNVAHQEIDLHNYKNNKKNAGFLPQERKWFEQILALGFIDAFRYLYPDKREYSWWNVAHNARERNIGWRLDYILVDSELKDYIIDCRYITQQFGSDHCPVEIELSLAL